MFTGIIEEVGLVKELRQAGDNIQFNIEAKITPELKIDQSVAHNGVCLTVIAIEGNNYWVEAIEETLVKSNLGTLGKNDLVNLERAMKLGDRLDGHIVQGHVDQVGTCLEARELDGSWTYRFQYDPSLGNVTIEKGSITVNGVSLTVVDSENSSFSVAIIPYTYKHTSFNQLQVGDKVNLEFDVIGKYVQRISQHK
ncbi:riboflavin synthase [Aureitalea marina]|uniref:Riboflavin synthase n=1 Tax=Aureitalea marina TaxID=930804 RepID=A0A2S7KSA5_9FLAO|nr:riboflavin synthase [Aureitalea marina]PQB05433.1 riboflavin synthase subunit alpha [Aureitalea marina]